jgi:putative membrane protein
MTEHDIHQLVLTFLYSGVGVLVFALAMFLVVKVAPFSVQKEIEEDQNTSLGIIIGSIMIGLAIIIAAAISSP